MPLVDAAAEASELLGRPIGCLRAPPFLRAPALPLTPDLLPVSPSFDRPGCTPAAPGCSRGIPRDTRSTASPEQRAPPEQVPQRLHRTPRAHTLPFAPACFKNRGTDTMDGRDGGLPGRSTPVTLAGLLHLSRQLTAQEGMCQGVQAGVPAEGSPRRSRQTRGGHTPYMGQ